MGDPLTVPCRWCGEATRFIATRCCDRCWELSTRIAGAAALARRMLDATASPASVEPFVVRHYVAEDRPTLKGNGFDGLEVGETRDEAERFVAFINEKLGWKP